jgi:hypothetical protein
MPVGIQGLVAAHWPPVALPRRVTISRHVQLLLIKPLIYGDCRGLSLIIDNHPLLQRQPSIFREARYCSAVCPYGLCRRAQEPLVRDTTVCTLT